jgi:hypothetical protein
MELLSSDEFATLLETQPGWHISMFMPMIQRGAATQQNPIRCKTLLRQVEEQLLANGLRSQEAQQLLQSLQQLLPNRDFWQRQSHGLAVFIAPQIVRTYRLPLALDALAVVSYRFHIIPHHTPLAFAERQQPLFRANAQPESRQVAARHTFPQR